MENIRRRPIRREDRRDPLIEAVRNKQPATKRELFEVLSRSHPEWFRTDRDVINTLHHYGGDKDDSSPEVLFERTSPTRWRLTKGGESRITEAPPREPGTARYSGPETSSVYERGQTVVPKVIRDATAIDYGTRLHWEVHEGVIHVIPIPKDPIRASRGILKGKGYTFAEFIADRNKERALERAQEQKEERTWRTSSIRPQS